MSSSTNPPQFSAVEMVQGAVQPLIKNAAPLIGGFVISVIIYGMVGKFTNGVGGLFIAGPLTYGLYAAALAAARGKTADFPIVFSGFERFLPTFLAGLLIAIFTGIGFVLCVLPGIIVTLLYLPTYCFMLDEGLDFWPAMEKSRITVMNNFAQWLLLGVVLIGINILGAIACGVGVLFTAPLSMVIVAMAYDMERSAARGAAPAVPDLPADGE